MAGAAHSAVAGERARPGAWGRSDAVLFVLTAVSLVLIAVQFAVAGFAAFTMDKTPTDNTYNAHVVLGLVIAAMTLLILAAVLANRAARAHTRTLWLAVTLAVLTIVVQPVLGEGGKHVPAFGALHSLNGLAIFVAVGWLAWETSRRKPARAGQSQP